MQDSRTFDDVSVDVWEKVKTMARTRFGTTFDPETSPAGTARTSTPVGDVVIDYDLDADAEQITYTLRRKPMFILSRQIWSGLEEAIDSCRQQS